MKLYLIIEKINSYFYSKYQRIDELPRSNKLIITKNTINTGKISIPLVILKGKIKFINKGVFKGIVISENGDFYNYGKFEGLFFCKYGTLFLKEKSTTVGVTHSHAIALQAGCIIDVELLRDNQDEFIEKSKGHLKEKEMLDIVRMIKSWDK